MRARDHEHMFPFVNFTVVNGTENRQLFTVTDQISGKTLLTDEPLEPGDLPVPLKANSSLGGHGLITFGYRGGVPTTNYAVSEGEQVSMQ